MPMQRLSEHTIPGNRKHPVLGLISHKAKMVKKPTFPGVGTAKVNIRLYKHCMQVTIT